jgi:hypothetical protein
MPFLCQSRKASTDEWLSGTGFNADEGASLLMTFGGLQAESVAQGEVHRAIAKELESLVVDPFEDWARGHKVQWFELTVL